MNRASRLSPYGCLLAAAMLAGCSEPPRPANVLLISVDTLRADALGVAGHPAARTPNIDRLAARGVYFTEAITPIPRTTPALASLLTGLWPQHHGSRDVGDPILDVKTLAEVLGPLGYTTLAVSANASAGPRQGLDRGFDRFVTYERLIETYGERLYRDLTDVAADQPGWAAAVTDQALELIDQAPAEPYFLWLFYFDPHFLYRPPSPWQDGVQAQRCWDLYAKYQDRLHQAGQVFADVGGVASRAVDDCRRLYDAEVAYTDHQIGRLLAALEERGRLDGTVIVFTADHGENFGEGGLFFEHGDNAHDAGLRVPLVFSGPEIEHGKRFGGAVSLVDVVPTVLGLLGLSEQAPGLDGRDLTPHLRSGSADPALRGGSGDPALRGGSGDPALRGGSGDPALRRVVFAESATAVWNEAVEYVTTGRTWWRVCINGPRYSLCEIPKEAPGVYRLYDHVEDPALTRDVAAKHPREVAALRELWKGWPPESARQRVARTAEFKLVEHPLLAGGYRAELYHLPTDPAESTDVRDRYPEVYGYLSVALARWTEDLTAPPPRRLDPELEATLRTLGYVP